MTHTKGPWTAGWTKGGITGPRAANMLGWDFLYPIVVDGGGYNAPVAAVSKRDEHHIANAHLIAAAPDMYEALKGVRAIFKRMDWQDDSIAIEGIDKAISKAEGK